MWPAGRTSSAQRGGRTRPSQPGSQRPSLETYLLAAPEARPPFDLTDRAIKYSFRALAMGFRSAFRLLVQISFPFIGPPVAYVPISMDRILYDRSVLAVTTTEIGVPAVEFCPVDSCGPCGQGLPLTGIGFLFNAPMTSTGCPANISYLSGQVPSLRYTNTYPLLFSSQPKALSIRAGSIVLPISISKGVFGFIFSRLPPHADLGSNILALFMFLPIFTSVSSMCRLPENRLYSVAGSTGHLLQGLFAPGKQSTP